MLRIRTTLLVLVLIHAPLGGCSDADVRPRSAPEEDPSAPELAVEVTDSAGIVHRRSPAAALRRTAYEVAPEAHVVIDGTEGGGQPLHAVGAVAFGPEGTLAIAERGEMGVRRHDMTGARLSVVGRDGQGPGEFGALNGLGFRADSMFVFDSRWSRISVFDPAGEYVRQVVPESAAGDRPRWFAFDPEVGILTTSRGAEGDLGWGLHGFDGESIASFPDAPSPANPKMGLVGASGETPPVRLFQAQPVAGLWNGGLVATSADRYRLELHDRSGVLHEIWSVADTLPRRVTDDDVDAARRRAIAATDPDARPAVERRWSDVETPGRFPAFGASSGIIFIDPPQIVAAPHGDDHELWIRAYPADPGVGPRWWVFRADGTVLGSVEFPAGFELHAVSEAGAVGVLEDEFEVQRVVVYALDPAGVESRARASAGG